MREITCRAMIVFVPIIPTHVSDGSIGRKSSLVALASNSKYGPFPSGLSLSNPSVLPTSSAQMIADFILECDHSIHEIMYRAAS